MKQSNPKYSDIVKALRNPDRFDYNRDLVPIMHKHPFIGPLLAAASVGADRIEELEKMLSYAAYTFDMLDGQTHANIECDAVAADCRSILNITEYEASPDVQGSKDDETI